MNTELIKQYKPEFDHQLYGGKLQHRDEFGKWYSTRDIWDSKDGQITTVVIDDEYLPFRKALAEGKIIQLNEAEKFADSNRGWVDLSCKSLGKSTNLFPVNYYRIKPEEPKFKVGDWVVEIHSTTKAQVLELFGDQIRIKFCYPDAIITTDSSDFIPWVPKEGDWCWFWNSGNFPKLRQFKRLLISNKYQYESCQTFTYDYCEPFLNSRPSYLKDK